VLERPRPETDKKRLICEMKEESASCSDIVQSSPEHTSSPIPTFWGSSTYMWKLSNGLPAVYPRWLVHLESLPATEKLMIPRLPRGLWPELCRESTKWIPSGVSNPKEKEHFGDWRIGGRRFCSLFKDESNSRRLLHFSTTRSSIPTPTPSRHAA